MRVGICEKNQQIMDSIYNLLLNYGDVDIRIFDGIDELSGHVNEIDCLIINISLLTLFDNKIYSSNPLLKIIYYSSYIYDALKGYELNGFRFLLYPIEKFILYDYLDEVEVSLQNAMMTFDDLYRRKRTINLLNICYIEMNGRRSTIHLKDLTTIDVNRTMKEWETVLDGYHFCQCYKGILVNLKCVDHIDNNHVYLKNGGKVNLSRGKKEKFCKQLSSLYTK